MTTPLSATELEDRLDELLAAVMSSRRTAAAPARTLAQCVRAQQDFVLRWVAVVAKTNAELAFQLASHAPLAFREMDAVGVEAWLVDALDVYDQEGLYPACAAVAGVREFVAARRGADTAVELEDVAGALGTFVQGLAGRTLKIVAHEQTYTDTQTIHLPARSAGFDRREDNFCLYKAMAAHQWAQNHFGTFRVDLVGALSAFPDPERATRLFHWLETVRLDACIARELPGLHRDLQALRASAGDEELTPRPATVRLKEPGATVGDTLAVLQAGYPGALPAPCCYQGVLRARRARDAGCVERDLPRGGRLFLQRVGPSPEILPQELVRAARARRPSGR